MVYFLAVTWRKVLAGCAAVAVLTYAVLWLALAGKWAWLDNVDTWTLRQFHDFGVNRPGWVEFWRLVSDVLSPTTLRIVGFVGMVVALLRRNVRMAVFLVLTVGASGLVTVTAKALSNRPRPETALTSASSTAFPSGHALGMTVGVLTVLTLLWPALGPRMRKPAIALGVGLIALVGLARVALNVHHPSDVVAGWSLGFLYYLLCLAVARPLKPNHEPSVHDSGLTSSG